MMTKKEAKARLSPNRFSKFAVTKRLKVEVKFRIIVFIIIWFYFLVLVV